MLENLQDRTDFFIYILFIYALFNVFLSELMKWSYSVCDQWVWSIGGMNVTGGKWSTQSKTCPSVPLCPPQIPCRPARDQTWAPVVRGQWLTAWATSQLPWLWTARKVSGKKQNIILMQTKPQTEQQLNSVGVLEHFHFCTLFSLCDSKLWTHSFCLCVTQYYENIAQVFFGE